MTINIPRRVRAALYIFTALGSPLVIYLSAKGIIGDLEVTLWLAETAVIAALAGFNLNPEE